MKLIPLVVTLALGLPACTININPPPVEAPAVPAAPAEPAPAEPADEVVAEGALVERFYAGGWRYCDARVLAAFWKTEPWEAKVLAGTKLAANDMGGLQRAVGQARTAARDGNTRPCPFPMSGYSYADAEALAKAWGTSVGEAKGRVETKVLWGDYGLIDQAIAEGRGAAPAPPLGPDEAAKVAFLQSPDLDLCHAKMLSAAWSCTVSQAKVILGHKVVGGRSDLMDEALGEARAHARTHPETQCAWADTGFRYADAEQIARLWDMTVEEAKVALTGKYLQGTEGSVRAFLASQTPGQ